jgi:hypothetical protein
MKHPVAIKVVLHSQLSTSNEERMNDEEKRRYAEKRSQQMIDEVYVLKQSRQHRNIVHYIDSFFVNEDIWLVMDYMEGGSLADLINTSFATNNMLTEGQIAAVSQEIANGLVFLHRNGVTHRDIKSDNILLDLVGRIKLGGSVLWWRIPAHPPGSRLWFMRGNFGSVESETSFDGWHCVLDGSRDCEGRGIWIKNRHLELGYRGHRYVYPFNSAYFFQLPFLTLL